MFHSNCEETPDGLEVSKNTKTIRFERIKNNNISKYDLHSIRELIKKEALKRNWIKSDERIFFVARIRDRGVLDSVLWEHNQLTEDRIIYLETPAWRRA